MSYTSRMVVMMVAIRRQRNGEVADSMRYYGARYGLNYGVSLPTLRTIARAEATDHDYARYLFQQDIREMKLAALWIADPAALVGCESQFWAAGIVNSELAEEAAFALLSRLPTLASIYAEWTSDAASSLLSYAAMLGASRHSDISCELLGAAIRVIARHTDDRLVAQGFVAMAGALISNPQYRAAVTLAIDSLDSSPSADFIREEVAWRLEA